MSSSRDWYTDRENLNSFLGYRYVIDDYGIPDWVFSIENELIEGDIHQLVSIGKERLNTTFNRAVDSLDTDATHVVSLSAGYDSRTILAELIERVDRDNILCVSYGSPGGFNFEMTPAIANEAGVEHRRIDLTPGVHQWSTDELIRQANAQETPRSLFGGSHVIEDFFGELEQRTEGPCYLWHGFMGDPSGGAHIDPTVNTWEDAVDTFLNLNYEHPELTTDGFEPRSVLPDEPLCEPDVLRYEEQLDYAIRQQHYIGGTGEKYKQTPFATAPWLEFAFNVPNEIKLEENLYRQILVDKHPKLFSLPSARDNGLRPGAPEWKQRVQWFGKIVLPYGLQQLGFDLRHPMMMHFDKNNNLRNNEIFIKQTERLLESLDRRNIVPHVDPMRLLKQHQRPFNLQNYGWELIVLASLEIHIRACNE